MLLQSALSNFSVFDAVMHSVWVLYFDGLKLADGCCATWPELLLPLPMVLLLLPLPMLPLPEAPGVDVLGLVVLGAVVDEPLEPVDGVVLVCASAAAELRTSAAMETVTRRAYIRCSPWVWEPPDR